MDDIDIQLCRHLIMNSRQSYRYLSKALGISNQAVHRRIQILEQIGVIQGFTVCLTDQFLNAVMVRIKGGSGMSNYEELVKALERDEHTLYLFFCSMNEIAITALLRDMSELDGYMEFLKNEAKMTKLEILFTGPLQFGRKGARQKMMRRMDLKALDYRIIYALSDDSRKSITDLAKTLDMSAKTVKRRLDRMMREGILEFSISYFPMAAPSVFTYLLVQVKSGADRKISMDGFIHKYDRYVLMNHSMSNLPDHFLMLLWAPSQKVVNDITNELSNDSSIASTFTYVIQSTHFFKTWRDRLVERLSKAS